MLDENRSTDHYGPRRPAMRISGAQLVVGAIAGGIVAWLWGDQLRRFADTWTHDIREKAADTLHSVQGKADGVMDTAKDQVHATLQASEDVIRPRIVGIRS